MIDDLRHELMWACSQTPGWIWPSDLAVRLGLDFGDVQATLEGLAGAGQLTRMSFMSTGREDADGPPSGACVAQIQSGETQRVLMNAGLPQTICPVPDLLGSDQARHGYSG